MGSAVLVSPSLECGRNLSSFGLDLKPLIDPVITCDLAVIVVANTNSLLVSFPFGQTVFPLLKSVSEQTVIMALVDARPPAWVVIVTVGSGPGATTHIHFSSESCSAYKPSTWLREGWYVLVNAGRFGVGYAKFLGLPSGCCCSSSKL